QTARFAAGRWRHLGKQAQGDARHAELDGRKQDPDQPEQAEGHGQQGNGQRQLVLEAAHGVKVAHQVLPPSIFAILTSSRREQASTTMVIRNRIRPSSISADVYMSEVASANSLARAEAMLLPGM